MKLEIKSKAQNKFAGLGGEAFLSMHMLHLFIMEDLITS